MAVVFSTLVFFGCAPEPFNKTKLVGTWKVDTYFEKPETAKSSTDLLAFRLVLKSDGTFVARNIPDDFFFDYTHTPAAREQSGKWEMRFETDGSYHLNLEFKSTSGFYGTVIEWHRGHPLIKVNKQNVLRFLTKNE
ncbi:MAG: hypothetical protein WCH99_07780 [Verrucomicrobiota bacterium]